MHPELDSLPMHERLAALVRIKGLTQKDLEDHVRRHGEPASSSTVYRWLNGKAKPGVDTLLALAALLGVGLEELILGAPAAPGGPARPPLTPEQERILWLVDALGAEEALARLIGKPGGR
jgi:transcriptional regulator with XRE-family HTH domain